MKADGVLAHAATVGAMSNDGGPPGGASISKETLHDLRRIAEYPWLPDPKVCTAGS